MTLLVRLRIAATFTITLISAAILGSLLSSPEVDAIGWGYCGGTFVSAALLARAEWRRVFEVLREAQNKPPRDVTHYVYREVIKVVEKEVVRVEERPVVRRVPMPPAREETDVYRLYDAQGELLYVGIGARARDRWLSHAAEKPWWDQVATHRTSRYPSRGQALAVEHSAIRYENPQHNSARGGLTDAGWQHGWAHPRHVEAVLPAARRTP